MVHFRHRSVGKAVRAEETIDGVGVPDGEELAPRVCPTVLRSAGNIDGSGRDKCDQHMLIDRQLVFPVVELFIVATKPVREIAINPSNTLSAFASSQGRTGTP